MKATLFIVILFFSANAFAQNSADEATKKLLRGKWASPADSLYTMVIGDSVTEYYDGKKTGTYSYKVNGNAFTEISTGGEIYQYEIIGLTDEYFTLMYMPKGNLINLKNRTFQVYRPERWELMSACRQY